MVQYFRIINGKLESGGAENADVRLYIGPTSEEHEHLVRDLGLDEHNLRSALDPDEIGRFEQDNGTVTLILKQPKNYSTADNLLFKVNSLGLFLTPQGLIVVAPEFNEYFNAKRGTRYTTIQDVMLTIIVNIIDHFFSHLKVINLITESLEQKISSSMDNKYLLNMFTLEKSLVYYLDGITSNATALERIRHNATKIGLTQEQTDLLDDVLIENQQCSRQADIYATILAGLIGARASIVNNNLSILMKTLNIITVSIMVPTFVVSVFSMNVGIPLSRNEYAFIIIVSLAAISMLLTLALIWKIKKW